MTRTWVTPNQFREKARKVADYQGGDEEEHELLYERFYALVEKEITSGSPYGDEIADIHASVCALFRERRYA